MAKGKSQQQVLVEKLLAKTNSKQSYGEWRAATLREVALDLVSGNGGEYADALLSVAVDKLVQKALNDFLGDTSKNNNGGPVISPDRHI